MFDRPELWITLSLLLLITTASVCGLVLFLRFRRMQSKRKNVEDHDATMVKVPNGEDPTYNVRDTQCLTSDTISKDVHIQ